MVRLGAQALLSLTGAVVGTLGDQIHVQSGVLWYRHPALGGQSVWVPFLFGTAGVGLVHAHRLFLRPKPGEPAPPARSLVVPGLIFAAAYLATGIGRSRPLLVAAALTVAWMIRLLLHPAGDKVAAGLAFAAGGPLFEAALSATGAFSYRHPDMLGVPVWLPALYLHLSLLTRQIHLVFRRQLGG